MRTGCASLTTSTVLTNATVTVPMSNLAYMNVKDHAPRTVKEMEPLRRVAWVALKNAKNPASAALRLARRVKRNVLVNVPVIILLTLAKEAAAKKATKERQSASNVDF